jgi:hypothetical protein
MTTLSIRRLWMLYAEIMFSDNTIAASKGGRMFSRTLAHGASYAGAALKVEGCRGGGNGSPEAPVACRRIRVERRMATNT